MPQQKRILEINPEHSILAKLNEVFDADPEAESLKDYGELLYGQALLAEGGELPNPGRFSKLVADLMTQAL